MMEKKDQLALLCDVSDEGTPTPGAHYDREKGRACLGSRGLYVD